MSELQQLKERIEKSGVDGIETAIVRDDYEPAGDMMIRGLVDTGEFTTRKVSDYMGGGKWKIFKAGLEPY
ncbi:MAG: hypothetical protein KAT62_03580 [Desulfuromonadales bacterium]|nr:hypothetical protein [Desulfuromonadales bacterium]